MGIIFALLYAVLVAFGKNLLKRSYDNTPSSVAFFLETLFGCLIWIPFGLISGIDLAQAVSILPIVLISAILSEAYIFYIYTKGEVIIIATVLASYSIYTILFSRIINNEILTVQESFFIGFCILGTLIISLPNSHKFKELLNSKAALWGLSGAIVVGFSDTISKSSIDQTSSSTFLLCLALCQIPVSLGYLKLEKIKSNQVTNIFTTLSKHKTLITSAFLIALGQLFFWLSFENTLASIASPLTASQVIFVVIIARFYLKEKVTLKNLIGIVFVVPGVIGVSIVTIS